MEGVEVVKVNELVENELVKVLVVMMMVDVKEVEVEEVKGVAMEEVVHAEAAQLKNDVWAQKYLANRAETTRRKTREEPELLWGSIEPGGPEDQGQGPRLD